MKTIEEGKLPAQYVLVRKDLPVFVQMVNVAHAAGEAIRAAPISKRTIVRLLHVQNEEELLSYRDKLVAKGFHVALVNEPDAPYNGQAMSLATEPLTERTSAVSKVVFHLRPAGKSYCPTCGCVLDDGRCTGCIYGS
jgi:hypothetical protein